MAIDIVGFIGNQAVGLIGGAVGGAVGGFVLRPLIKQTVRNFFIKLRKNLVEELKSKPKYKAIITEAIFLAQKELGGKDGKERLDRAVAYCRAVLPDGFIEDIIIEAIQDVYEEIIKPLV